MPKILKITIIVALTLLGLAGAGAWYAASLINPDKLVQILSSTVKDSTGRDLKIAGSVSVNVFPSLGITAEQVSLSNASWASKSDLVLVKRMELDIQLLPLLSKRVEFNTVTLSGLDIYLQTNKSGNGNWDLTAPTSNIPSASASSAASSSATDSAPADPMKIEHLLINNAQLHYQGYGRPERLVAISKLIIHDSARESEIDGQANDGRYQFAVKGKTGNLRQAFNDWDVNPVKLNVNLDLTLNGKSLALEGDIQKLPKAMTQFDLRLNSSSLDISPSSKSTASTPTKSTGAPVSENPTSSAVKTTSSTQGQYFFSEENLPFSALPNANGKLEVNIAQLSIPGEPALSNLKGLFTFNGDQISAQNFSFDFAKGSVEGQLLLSGLQSSSPSVAIKGLAKGFSLQQLSDASDPSSKVSGGDMQAAFNIKSNGMSSHQLASHANGVVQISVGQGKLDSRFLDRTGDLMITAINAINPMRNKSDQTTLECAVAYLPISNGLVNIDNSVGAVTDRLYIILAGTINLNNEALNIRIEPKERSGLTTGVDLAGLVKMEGTILHPSAGVNKIGVINSAVTIGLGILTGGATLLAENAKSLTTKAHPCKAALHPWSDIYPGNN